MTVTEHEALMAVRRRVVELAPVGDLNDPLWDVAQWLQDYLDDHRPSAQDYAAREAANRKRLRLDNEGRRR